MSLYRKSLQGLGVLALVTGFVACSSDENKGTGNADGGETGGKSGGTGGKSGGTGGADTDAGTGGAATGGSTGKSDAGTDSSVPSTDGGDAGPSIGDGGDGGPPAVLRFCNDLTFGTTAAPEDTTFKLVIGTGASAVSLTAKTGFCDPVDGKACLNIPVGKDIPVDLFDMSDPTTSLLPGTIDIKPGEQLVFATTLSGDPVGPDLDVFPVAATSTCDDIVYDDVYPPKLAAQSHASDAGKSYHKKN